MEIKKYENDKRDLPFGHSAAIQDPEVNLCIENFKPNIKQVLDTDAKYFVSNFLDWIRRSKNNKIIGLEDFKYAVYSNGTSESFDKFYQKNSFRRFRCFKGEYLYHKLAWRDCCPNFKFIEDEVLDQNDAVVISLPFADTGSKHHSHDQILEKCQLLNIPVLIDCCYFAISSGIVFDFNYSCITDITFSLSKVFPVAHARIGMRLTRDDVDDTLIVYEKNSYNNRVGAALGQHLIDHFSVDFIVEKYKDKQIKFCKHLEIEASNTVIFGTSNRLWPEYNRGSTTNRLSLYKFLHLSENEFIEIIKGIKNGC